MVAAVRHDILGDEQIYNDTRQPNHENHQMTSEMDSINARQQEELSADMMQLLTEALDDFDEPCSRVRLVHRFTSQDDTTCNKRFTMQHEVCGRSAVEMDEMINADISLKVATRTSEQSSAQFFSFSTPSRASETRCQRGQMPIEPEVPTSKTPLSPLPLSPLQMNPTEPTVNSETQKSTQVNPCRELLRVPEAEPVNPMSLMPTSPTPSERVVPVNPVSQMPTSDEALDPTTWPDTMPAMVTNRPIYQHVIQPTTPLMFDESSSGGATMHVSASSPGRPPGSLLSRRRVFQSILCPSRSSSARSALEEGGRDGTTMRMRIRMRRCLE